MPKFDKTERSTVVRGRHRARYDTATVHEILDQTHFCDMAFIDEGMPVVLPINHWRIADHLYFHGSPASRRMKILCSGAEVCVTATLLDGLVLARSASRHSVNYRSAVIFGRGHEVSDSQEKMVALERLIEHLIPGRWAEIRKPTVGQLKATAIAALPITEASAKVRTGGPTDEEADYALPVWAGVIPLKVTAGTPEADDRLDPSILLPGYLVG